MSYSMANIISVILDIVPDCMIVWGMFWLFKMTDKIKREYSQLADKYIRQCEFDEKLEKDFYELYKDNLRLRKELEARNGK